MDIVQFMLILTAFSFFSLFIFLKPINKGSSPNNLLPPGPRKLPLIGNLHNLVLTGSVLTPHRALHHLAFKYGPLMHLKVGGLSTVVVSSTDAAKQILKTHDINFASRTPIIAAEVMSYGRENSIIVAPYGDYWRLLRKICKGELLNSKRIKSFESIREQVFSDLSRRIACNKAGLPINLTEKLKSLTYAVVSRSVLGKKSSEEQEALRIGVIGQIVEWVSSLHVADLYPSIELVQKITGFRLRRLHEKIDRMLEEIIQEHKGAANGDGSKRQDEEDMVDVLLKFQDGDGLLLSLTDARIKSILDILAGGSDTTATTIVWAMAEILKNPRVLQKAQNEVRQVFDEKGYVDESDIHQLKYLKSIVKETLRLHPAIPLIPRKCRQKCELNGYEIPVDTEIVVNAWAINRDPKYWKNADSFEPERFLESLVDYKGNCFEYITFGAGRRICPGMFFALANVEFPLAMFLYHFDWNLSIGVKHEEMDMKEKFGVTVSMAKDLYVVPTIKRALPVINKGNM